MPRILFILIQTVLQQPPAQPLGEHGGQGDGFGGYRLIILSYSL